MIQCLQINKSMIIIIIQSSRNGSHLLTFMAVLSILFSKVFQSKERISQQNHKKIKINSNHKNQII